MDARIANTVGEMLRRLPVKGAGRDLALQRLTDIYAEREATAAVHAAAARSRESLRQRDPGGEAEANAVSAANALSGLGAADAGRLDTDLATDALRREQLSGAFLDPAFLAIVPAWIVELRQVAAVWPGSGACTIASAMQLWAWTMSHLQSGSAQRAGSELAQALSPLIAARAQILEVVREEAATGRDGGTRDFFLDLCHIQAARAAGAVGMLSSSATAAIPRGTRRDAPPVIARRISTRSKDGCPGSPVRRARTATSSKRTALMRRRPAPVPRPTASKHSSGCAQSWTAA
jgi:hypothetical protein